MARIAGIELPNEKRIDISLTVLYGIGRSNAKQILKAAKIDPSLRTKNLSEEDINKLQKIIESLVVEGDLRQQITQNIRRMIEVGAYRGLRHARGLPVRGQRTRSNARTKRGKRVTIGTVRKEVVAKMGTAKVQSGQKTTDKKK